MPTRDRKKKTETKEQLNVRISAELERRVRKVAEALHQDLAEFVSATLDERTRPHKAKVEEILAVEKEIAERDKSRKQQWP